MRDLAASLAVVADHLDATVAARVAVVLAETFGDEERAVSRLLADPLTAAVMRDALVMAFAVDGRPPQPRVAPCDLVLPAPDP